MRKLETEPRGGISQTHEPPKRSFISKHPELLLLSALTGAAGPAGVAATMLTVTSTARAQDQAVEVPYAAVQAALQRGQSAQWAADRYIDNQYMTNAREFIDTDEGRIRISVYLAINQEGGSQYSENVQIIIRYADGTESDPFVLPISSLRTAFRQQTGRELRYGSIGLMGMQDGTYDILIAAVSRPGDPVQPGTPMMGISYNPTTDTATYTPNVVVGQ